MCLAPLSRQCVVEWRTHAHNADMTFEVAVSLEPNPVIEAYKKDVDRTMIRENLKLTPEQRIFNMMSVARFADAVRASRVKR